MTTPAQPTPAPVNPSDLKNPAVALVVLTLVEKLIEMEPQIVGSIQKVLTKQNPTPADWAAERLEILSKSYKDFVPDSQLPAS